MKYKIPNPSVGRRRYFKRLQEKPHKLTQDEKDLIFERKKPKTYKDFLKRTGQLERFNKLKESVGYPQIQGKLPPEYDIIDGNEDY